MAVTRPEAEPSRGPATLAEVARLAGVSLSTASKALNGRRQVAPATRRRVEDAARRLDFTPNPLARGLLAGRTGTVGLLTSDLDGRFVLPILMGAEDAFGAGRISIFLCDARGDAIREQHHLQALLSRRVDGLIVVGSRTDPRPSLGHRLGVPVVYAYAPSEDGADLSLVPDNVGAGRLAIEHLLACGSRRIGHLTGDPSFAAARDRAAGADLALTEAGLARFGDVMYGEWSERWGRDATALLLRRHPDVDAIVCGSDQIARGALDVLRDRGRDVPGDVAVLGFDNWEVLTRHSRPALTSVDANLQQLGRAAAQRVFAALDGVDVGGGRHHLPARLVVRGSTVPQQ